MSRVLKIRLNLADGKLLTYTLQDPISNLRMAQVEIAMNNMINDDAILINNQYPTGFKDAYYYETNTTYLE